VNYIDVKLSRHMRENSLTYARPHRNYPKKYIAIWQIARRGRHNPFYAPAIKSGSKNAISLLSIKQGWFLETDECFFFKRDSGGQLWRDTRRKSSHSKRCLDPRGIVSLSTRVQV